VEKTDRGDPDTDQYQNIIIDWSIIAQKLVQRFEAAATVLHFVFRCIIHSPITTFLYKISYGCREQVSKGDPYVKIDIFKMKDAKHFASTLMCCEVISPFMIK